MNKLPEKIVENLRSGSSNYYRLISPCTDYSRYVSLRIFELLQESNENVTMTSVTDRGIHVTHSEHSIFDYLHMRGDEKRSYERILKTIRSASLSNPDIIENILKNEYLIVHEVELIDQGQLEYIIYFLRVLTRTYASIQAKIRRRIMWLTTLDQCPSRIMNIFSEHYLSYIMHHRDVDEITQFFYSINRREYDENLADQIVEYMIRFRDNIGRLQFKDRLGFELTHIAIKNIIRDMSDSEYDKLSDSWYDRDVMASTRHDGGHRSVGYMKLILFHNPYTFDARILPRHLQINNINFKMITLPSSSRLDNRLLVELALGRSSDQLRSWLLSCQITDCTEFEHTHIQLLEDYDQVVEINQRQMLELDQISPIEYYSYDGKMTFSSENIPLLIQSEIPLIVDAMFESRWCPRTIEVKFNMRVFITDTMLVKTTTGSDLTVMSGQLGNIIWYDNESVHVRLDSGETIVLPPRPISIRVDNVEYVRYQLPISIGYAITFRDARMTKFDRTLVHLSGIDKPGLAYHALTRFRDDLRIVGNLDWNDIIPMN